MAMAFKSIAEMDLGKSASATVTAATTRDLLNKVLLLEIASSLQNERSLLMTKFHP